MRNISTLGCCFLASTALLMRWLSADGSAKAPVTPSVQAKTSSSCKVKSGYEHLSKAPVPFTWVQQQEEFDIELTGILGAGKTQISGTPGQVTLNSAKTGLIKAATAEELLQRATGWQAPISHLVDWVQARPATQSAQIQKDSSQRISQIIEQGWTVDLSYNQQATVPKPLDFKAVA